MGICLFLNQYFILKIPEKEAVEATVAALIGMIPEGLYLLTSIAIAVSVMNLAGRKVLVRDMNCVEFSPGLIRCAWTRRGLLPNRVWTWTS